MAELEQKNFQKRQLACKIRISDIINANFEKSELYAGYLKINNSNVSRVSVIGTVVYKSSQENNTSTIIDDGTGKILLRSFENSHLFANIDVGDIILTIGRIREFNNEKYIIPEILKKTELGWFNVRKMELKNIGVVVEDKEIEKNDNIKPQNMNDEIYLLIKTMDNGDGASIEDVISRSKAKDSENIINKLLESGDVFEIRPGRLKVLE